MALINFGLELQALGNLQEQLRQELYRAVAPELSQFAQDSAQAALDKFGPDADVRILKGDQGVTQNGLFWTPTEVAGLGLFSGTRNIAQIISLKDVVHLVINEMLAVMSQATAERLPTWKTNRNAAVPRSIRVFIYGVDGGHREVTNLREIDLQKGESLTFSYSDPWASISNTRHRGRGGPLRKDDSGATGGGGFVGLAARRLRTKLRTSRGGKAGIRVYAFRSVRLVSIIGAPHFLSKEGWRKWRTQSAWGYWAIAVKIGAERPQW